MLREGDIKGSFNLKPRQKPYGNAVRCSGCQGTMGDVKEGPWHPEANGIIGKNRIDFFSRTKQVQQLIFFPYAQNGRILKYHINL